MNILELFALIKKQDRTPDSPILKIVRTYEGKGRADQDLELIEAIDPEGVYFVQTIQHIE